MKKKKIILIMNNFAMGGTERFLLDLIPLLRKTIRINVVTVLGGGVWKRQFENVAGPLFSAVPARSTSRNKPYGKLVWIMISPIVIFRLYRYIRRERPDVVISSLFLADVLGMSLARWCGVRKRILIQHDVHQFGRIKHFMKVHFGMRNATHIVAVSEAVKSFLIDEWGIAPEKITVIINGVRSELFQRGVKDSHATEKTIGFLGRLESIKGIETFIEALSILYSRGIKPHVRIGGDGSLRERIERTIKENNLSNVHMMGMITDTPSFFRQVDSMVIPSEEEGLGLVAIEALIAQKVVVATDIPAFREIMEDGKNCILVQTKDAHALANAIEEIVTNTDTYEHIHDGVCKWIKENEKRFSIQHTARLYKDIWSTD